MHAKSNAKRSACTKPAAPPSSPSADRDQRSGVVRGSPPGQKRDPSGIGRSSNGRASRDFEQCLEWHCEPTSDRTGGPVWRSHQGWFSDAPKFELGDRLTVGQRTLTPFI